MSNKLRILLIRNPSSGSGKRGKVVDQVISELKKQDVHLEMYFTKAPGDAIDFLLNYNMPMDIVVAAGGDGTINEVLNGIVNKNVRVAVIPAGTTNVLSKELALPKSPKALADIIINGIEKPVYLCRLNKRRFSMMVGVGYDAWIVNNVNLEIKKEFGKLAYIISLVKEVFTFGAQNYQVKVDGKEILAGSMIITNGKYYAGSFILSRQADLSRDTVQAIIISPMNRLKFLAVVCSMPLGLMESLPFVHSIAAKEIEISAIGGDETLDVLEADGDKAGRLPARVQVEEQAVSFLVSS